LHAVRKRVVALIARRWLHSWQRRWTGVPPPENRRLPVRRGRAPWRSDPARSGHADRQPVRRPATAVALAAWWCRLLAEVRAGLFARAASGPEPSIQGTARAYVEPV